MRILHLVAYHLWSGPAAPTAALVDAQERVGHQVWVAWDTHRRQARYEEPIGPRMEAFDFAPPERLALSTKAPFWVALRDRVRLARLALQVDVIHCHMSHDHALAATLRRPKGGPVLVRSLHAARSFRKRLGQSWLLARTDGVVVRAAAQRDALIERFGLAPARVTVIHAGVDLQQWRLDQAAVIRAAAEIRARYELGDGPVVVLAAMMQAGRGHGQLLAAWRQVREALPAARLLLVGEGECQDDLQGLATRLSVQDSVRFTGYLTQERLRAVYAAADLAVLITPGNDLAGRTVLEAMSCGRPVLVVTGGCGEGTLARAAVLDAVLPGCTGLVAASDEPADLASSLLSALLERGRLKQLGEAARQYMAEHRSVRAEATATLAWYAHILAVSHRRGGS